MTSRSQVHRSKSKSSMTLKSQVHRSKGKSSMTSKSQVHRSKGKSTISKGQYHNSKSRSTLNSEPQIKGFKLQHHIWFEICLFYLNVVAVFINFPCFHLVFERRLLSQFQPRFGIIMCYFEFFYCLLLNLFLSQSASIMIDLLKLV